MRQINMFDIDVDYEKLEKLDSFIERVSEEANNLDGKVLNIQYLENTSNSYDCDAKSPSCISGAVIVYKVKQIAPIYF